MTVSVIFYNIMKRYERCVKKTVLEGLEAFPAVFIGGPRQAGKSTLAREIATKDWPAEYVTLDQMTTLSSAAQDPEGFLSGFSGSVVIDEIQLAPALFRVLKRQIDEMRWKQKRHSKKRFLLTGSASIMALPELSDALVGRMKVLNLYPLSMREVFPKKAHFMDIVMSDTIPTATFSFSLADILARATYPELAIQPKLAASAWFENYLKTLLQRDVRSLAEIEKISALPNMLKILAHRAGGLLNDADAARDASLNHITYRRYRVLLEQLYLIFTLPAWSRNIGKRWVKAPKLYFTDTAMLAHLLGMDIHTLRKKDPALYGKILENFVASELLKELSYSQNGSLYHFRLQNGYEVDFVIEKPDGRIIGIEVKSKETLRADDFKGLHALRESAGNIFLKGIILYQGKEVVPIGKNLWAVPL